MIKLLIADNSVLIREGFRALLNDVANFNFVGYAENYTELKEKNSLFLPDVLIVDCVSLLTGNAELKALKKANRNLHILAITQMVSKNDISGFLNGEVTSYLLKECDREEIIEAITETNSGRRFLCGKIAHVLNAPSEINPSPAYLKSVSCEGITVTEREADVIKHIAEGLSNKQIADKLFLSTHTVNTHRKNIMNKLGVNNTAGIVMYAVKNNLLERNNLLFSN